jgi:DNA polymerase (family 10)
VSRVISPAHDVVLEINAHPRRLDLDWSWIPAAMEKGVMLSIDPDAHAIDGFGDVRYGVLAAQKGGLTRECNLSSLSLEEFTAWLERTRKKRG